MLYALLTLLALHSTLYMFGRTVHLEIFRFCCRCGSRSEMDMCLCILPSPNSDMRMWCFSFSLTEVVFEAQECLSFAFWIVPLARGFPLISSGCSWRFRIARASLTYPESMICTFHSEWTTLSHVTCIFLGVFAMREVPIITLSIGNAEDHLFSRRTFPYLSSVRSFCWIVSFNGAFWSIPFACMFLSLPCHVRMNIFRLSCTSVLTCCCCSVSWSLFLHVFLHVRVVPVHTETFWTYTRRGVLNGHTESKRAILRIRPRTFHRENKQKWTFLEHLNPMLGSCLISNFLLTMRRSTWCYHLLEKFTERNHWILPISSLRIGPEKHGSRFLQSLAYKTRRDKTRQVFLI